MPGAGVLLLGVSDHVIAKNNIEDNGLVGVGVLGWCTALAGGPRACDFSRPDLGLRWPPQANNNLISQNKMRDNGGTPVAGFPLPDVDLFYVQFEPDASGNCFKKNKGVATFYSSEPDGELPTDGC